MTIEEEPIEIGQFCVCDDEWCFCMNRVVVPLQLPIIDKACEDCLAGKHVHFEATTGE